MFTTPAIAVQSFGKFGDDSSYTTETIAENTGRLIIFTCPQYKLCAAVGYMLGSITPYYYIQINGNRIASIFGMDYLDVNLPIGTYSIDVFKYNDFGTDYVASSFEVLIKENRTISIISEPANSEGTSYSTYQVSDVDKLLSYSFLGMTWHKAKLNEPELNNISESYLRNVSEVSIKERVERARIQEQSIQSRAENAKEIELKRLESRKLRNEREDKALRDERIKEDAEYQRLEDERKRQKDIEEALTKKDDATCKSYGAKKGSPAYVQCRSTQVANRQETADRQKTIDALEKRIDILQSQIQSQSEERSQSRERDQRLSSEQSASDQEFKNKQLELQQEQLRILQQQQSEAREAARWEAIRQLNDPARWNQKAPPLPTVPRRLNCQTIGSNTTCW